MDGRTIGGRINQGGGGVGRNIADALAKLDLDPFLITAIGDEGFGEFVTTKSIPHLNSKGIIKVRENGTGTCMVLCDHTGECLFVVGDMDIHDRITVDEVRKHEKKLAESSLVVVDGNLREDTLNFVMRFCRENSVPVWYEPTDYFKASKPFHKQNTIFPNFISPNYQEFLKIYEAIHPKNNKNNIPTQDLIENCVAKGVELAEYIDNIIITLGKNGVLIIRRGEAHEAFFKDSVYVRPNGVISHRLYEPEIIPEKEVVNVSGAGDCFASGFIACMLKGLDEKNCIEFGFKCSTASLKCHKPVPLSFS